MPDTWLKGHTSAVRALAFLPSGGMLATASYDGSCRLWHSRSGAELAKYVREHAIFTSLAVAHKANILVVGDANGKLTMLSVPNMLALKEIDLQLHIASIVIKGDDSIVFASRGQGCDVSGELAIVDSQVGRVLKTVRLHNCSISALALSPNGEIIAAVFDDGMIGLWHIRDLEKD